MVACLTFFDMGLNGFDTPWPLALLKSSLWPLSMTNPIKTIQNQLSQYDKARGGIQLLSSAIGFPAAGVSPKLGAGQTNEKHETVQEFCPPIMVFIGF